MHAHPIAEPVLPNSATGMEDDIVANQRTDDRCTRSNRAVAPDLHVLADHRRSADHGSCSDCCAWSDHRARIDAHAILDLSRRMDDGTWRHSFPEKRERAQGIGIKLPRHGDESTIGLLCAQHVETARCLAFETLGCQAGAGLRPCQGVGVFGGVEECEVGRARSIERCDICNDVIEASPVTKLAPVEQRSRPRSNPRSAGVDAGPAGQRHGPAAPGA